MRIAVFANLDNGLVQQFRSVIFRKHGLRKGDLSRALEEALIDYIKKYSNTISE
jgi:hypothetical protein